MGVRHLAHIEIACPDLNASRDFFTELIGLRETTRADGSVYLRAFGDWLHHTLVLTPGDEPGVRHIAWGVDAPGDLERAERRMAELGVETWWHDEEPGQGRALRLRAPGGHVHELVHDVARTSPGMVESRLHNYPLARRGRGIEPTRLDHVNVLSAEVGATGRFLNEELGFRLNERIVSREGHEAGQWMAVSNLAHDLACMHDATGATGRLHHVAYWLDSRDLVMRAADLLIEADTRIEAGPGKHGISQALFLYFHEPSGNRVELFSSTYLIFEANWEPILWTPDDKDRVEIAMTGFRLRDYVGDHGKVAA